MRLVEILDRHRRVILLSAVMIVVAGAFAATRLPVGLFPRVDFPRIAVVADAGDRSAERMLAQVTIPLEEAVRSVPGVRSMRSRTSRGSSELSINFDWGHDMVVALLQLQAAVAERAADLPRGTSFSVLRMDPTVFPVLGYSLVSDTRSPVELRDIARLRVRPALLPIEGVARVDVLGGHQEEVQVTADPAALEARGLTMKDLADALAASNTSDAAGRLEDHFKLYLVMADSSFRDIGDVESAVVRSAGGAIFRVGDVAAVERRTIPEWTRVTADGHDAVLVQVSQQPDGNTVRIASDAAARLKELAATLPPGVKIANWYDQGELVRLSAASLRDALLIGSILAALVLLVFLQNVRITLIALLTVPSVLGAACLLLLVLGQSLNIMTLGGMAAAVGLIIDDAIVMIEHIVRRVRAGGPSGGALPAAAEFTRPLIGASAATIVINIPPAFLSGVTGAFFKALSLTIAVSLIVSFLMAWLVIPLLAERLLRGGGDHRDAGPIFRAVLSVYRAALSLMLRARWLVILPVAAVLAVGGYAYPRLASGFMPAMDEGGFVLDYRSAPGTSLAETDRLLRQIEAVLRATPEVETYSRRTGLQLGGGVITEANEGDFFIRLKPPPRRPIEDVMDEVRGKVEATIPGLNIEMIQLMEDLIGDLTAVPQPIEIKLHSEDQDVLFALAPRVADAISKVPGVVDVNDGRALAGDALEVRVDPIKAAVEGIDAATAAGALTDALSGAVATEYQVFGDTPKSIGVRVWTPPRSRAIEEDLLAVRVAAPDGHLVPLRQIATLTRITGQAQIVREDLGRMVAVTARISGADLGSTIRRVREALAAPGLLIPPAAPGASPPAPIPYTLGGLYEQQREAFAGLLGVFAAAVVLVFLLLVAWYESLRAAACLTLTSLLAVPGVIAGLWLSGTELNISSMMGLAMIVGIVTEVGVFLVSEYLEPLEAHGAVADGHAPGGRRGSAGDELVRASSARLRPIVMTTLAAILAMLPLVVGMGQGSAMLRPLAVAITAGLVVQLPLVLLVLPVLLALTGVVRRDDTAPTGP